MIAVSSSGPDLGSMVDPMFGRCRYFLFIDENDMSYKTVENTAARGSGGVGPLAAQLLMENGAKALISGNVGPNAFRALSQGGIPVYLGEGMTVSEALLFYGKGELKQIEAPTSMGHHG